MKKYTIAIIMIAALSACTTSQSLYSWHGYEDATYRYSKEATDERLAKVVEQYQKILNDQRGSRGHCAARPLCRIWLPAVQDRQERRGTEISQAGDSPLPRIGEIHFTHHQTA